MISVVVPVYNSIGTLERCVDSLLAQTYRELEIILVEDSSTDGSDRLCDEIAAAASGVRVIHKGNEGVSAARNAGIDAARGEFVMFTDSDDYVEPEMAERLLRSLGENDLALCGFHHHYHGRDIIKSPVVSGTDEAEVFLELYGGGFMNMPWNKLFRRDFLGRFRKGLSLGEDLLFNLDYLERTRGISVVGEPLCHYIQDDTGRSLSSQKRSDRYELARLIRRETGDFYRKLAGHEDTGGVIDGRFLGDVLDDVESLPFDMTRGRREKLQVIESYCTDEDFVKASRGVRMEMPDYRIILYFMKKKMKRTVYTLCVIRSWLVKLGAHNG